MSKDNTESKSLPASNIKLKRQREKGQIAKSPELYSSTSAVIGFIMLLMFSSYWLQLLLDIFEGSAQASAFEWTEAVNYMLPLMGTKLLILVMPVVGAILAAVLLSNLVYNRGVAFSLEPIKPKFDRLNPAEGLKRLFGRRAMIEASQKLLRLVLWFGAVALIVWSLRSDIFNAVFCGEPCYQNVRAELVFQIMMAAIVVFLIGALIDMPLQKALFMQDMKMGQSERKREDKDQHGAPEIRYARKRAHREIVSGRGATRLENATLLLTGNDAAVAIQYDVQKGGIPMVVTVAQGSKAPPLVQVATQSLGLPTIQEDDLVAKLLKVGQGAPVPRQYFDQLALAMIRAGQR